MFLTEKWNVMRNNAEVQRWIVRYCSYLTKRWLGSTGDMSVTHTATRVLPWNFGSSLKDTAFCTLFPGFSVNGWPVSASVPVNDSVHLTSRLSYVVVRTRRTQ